MYGSVRGAISDGRPYRDSRHFAEQLAEQGARDRINAVIVIDMIGDSHLDIQREMNSTPWLTDFVFTQAQRLGYERYFLNRSPRIEDAHLGFLRLGFPAVDIIDLDYGPLNRYWHTPSDTVDKCSAASLAIVGDTVLRAFDTLEGRVSKPII